MSFEKNFPLTCVRRRCVSNLSFVNTPSLTVAYSLSTTHLEMLSLMKRVITPHSSTFSMLITCMFRRIRTLVLDFNCAERDICDYIFHPDIRYHRCLTCTSRPSTIFCMGLDTFFIVATVESRPRLSVPHILRIAAHNNRCNPPRCHILHPRRTFILFSSLMMFIDCNESLSTNSFSNVSRSQWKVEDGKSHYLYVQTIKKRVIIFIPIHSVDVFGLNQWFHIPKVWLKSVCFHYTGKIK